jgi:hypothetical protein
MTANPFDNSGSGISSTQGYFVTVVQLSSGVAVAAGSAVVNVG